jgi:hypothetical protein
MFQRAEKSSAEKRTYAPAVMTPDHKREGSQAIRTLGFIVVVGGPDQCGSVEMISIIDIISISMRGQVSCTLTVLASLSVG